MEPQAIDSAHDPCNIRESWNFNKFSTHLDGHKSILYDFSMFGRLFPINCVGLKKPMKIYKHLLSSKLLFAYS